MTAEMLISIGGLVILGLVGLVGWFLRKLILDVETEVKNLTTKLGALDQRVSDFKLAVEQNFVSFDTYQDTVGRFTKNFEKIFEQLAAQTAILARLDERSKWEERFTQILDRVAPKRK